MLPYICGLFLFAAPTVVLAADAPKPNSLTPKEIEEGWILLFDGETTYGWKTEGDVKVEEGQIKNGRCQELFHHLDINVRNL